jgi:hypothetical protein
MGFEVGQILPAQFATVRPGAFLVLASPRQCAGPTRRRPEISACAYTVAVSRVDVNRLNTPVFAHCGYHSPTLIVGAEADQFNLDPVPFCCRQRS